MAGYTDNREQNMEMKYLYKVWSQVDSNIQLPVSLTGDALLPKLDGIYHSAPVSRKIRFSPRVFTWHSGVTYAAALVLIVALSTVLGRGTPSDILQGTVPEMEQAPQADSSVVVMAEALPEETADTGTGGEIAMDTAEPVEDSVAKAPSSQAAPPVTREAAMADQPATFAVEGVGGPGESVLLGVEGEYIYTYRPNDATDPDKGSFPITVSIIDTDTQNLAFMIDVPDMLMVHSFFVGEGSLALVGPGETGVTLRTYDLTQVGEAVEQFVGNLPGLYLDANQYKNILHVVTLCDGAPPLATEIIPLPDSTTDASCLFTALDIETQSITQKAFSGAGSDISLHNLNAYLKYEGAVTEENVSGQYVAQIRLDGMNIDLGGQS